MEQKNWYLSKTIWSQLVAVICLGLSVTGVAKVDEALQSDIVTTIINVVGILSQVYAIYGRVVATTKIVS